MTWGDWLRQVTDPHPVWDFLRLVVAVQAFILAVVVARVAVRAWLRRRSHAFGVSWPFGLSSYALLMLVAAAWQVQRVGQPLAWPLVPLLLAVTLGVLAVRQHYRLRIPPHFRPRPRGSRRH